jgi:hypothetical protein
VDSNKKPDTVAAALIERSGFGSFSQLDTETKCQPAAALFKTAAAKAHVILKKSDAQWLRK